MIPLSAFNHNPSQATRAARSGEVVLTDRGVPVFRLTRIEPTSDPLAALVAAGLARPAKSASWPTGKYNQLGLGADLDEERAAREW